MIKNKIQIPIIILFIFIAHLAKSQTYERSLKWVGIKSIINYNQEDIKTLYFNDAVCSEINDYLPSFTEIFEIDDNYNYKVNIQPLQTLALNEAEVEIVNQKEIQNDFHLNQETFISCKNPYLHISLVTIRKNPVTNKFEKLLSFRILLEKRNLQ